MNMSQPQEFWMLGREAAIGTSLYWNIHHKVLRNGEWIDATPYSCFNEAFAREEAEKMSKQTAHDGRNIYRDVSVSGPHVQWREIWWKYK